jgi:hypothetical protein
MLDTSYNNGCHLTNRFRLEPNDYEVVSPLFAPPWCRLVVPADCRIASCRPLIAPLSCRLVAPAGCRIASRRPLIALPSRCLITSAGCCITSRRPLNAPPSCQLIVPACCHIVSHHLSSSSRCAPHRPLVLSSCRLVVASPLGVQPSRHLVVSLCRLSLSRRASWSSRHHLLLSSCCTTLSSSHRAGWLAPPSRPLVVVHRPRHRTPSNAAAAIEYHRHRLSIVHRWLPQLSSMIAAVKCQPSPSSITAVKR